mmetsp:Transcript_20964/g.53103  ORF Transcript_20964/g.53103 Transcript_20964/m.53103 type:complete len:173 (+) Transcript_20964:95-613(+)
MAGMALAWQAGAALAGAAGGFGLASAFGAGSALEVAPLAVVAVALARRGGPAGHAALAGVAGSGLGLSLGAAAYRTRAAGIATVRAGAADSDGASMPARAAGVPLDKLAYLAPIAVAPIAHNLVTLGAARGARRAGPFLAGAGLVTVGAIVQRLWLMEDAGIDSGRAILHLK